MKIDRVEFNKLLNERVLFLDGAYGTVFMQQGFTDQPAIQLNLTAPEVVYKLHKEYLAAGADIILTNTFSGNRRKLKELGLEDKFFQLNKAAVELALDAAGDKLVFANLSSTGEFPQPLGSLSWYEVKDIFKEQAELLVAQGVDGFMIETMSDLKEIKAALLAVREVAANLPVIAQMTFAETFYSATGSYLKSFAALFSDLDVDVIGINCTLTPEEILPLLNELIKLTDKPVSVEANAGQPIFQDGQLSYPGSAREFMRASEKLVATGVNLLGGCCGTTPEYIEALVKQYQGSKFSRKKRNDVQYIASRSKIVGFDEFVSIGEQINPAGNKRLQDDIYNRNYNLLSQKAVLQKNAGAKALDINLGIKIY